MLIDEDNSRGISGQHFRVQFDISTPEERCLELYCLSDNGIIVDGVQMTPGLAQSLLPKGMIVRAGPISLQLRLPGPLKASDETALQRNWLRFLKELKEACPKLDGLQIKRHAKPTPQFVEGTEAVHRITGVGSGLKKRNAAGLSRATQRSVTQTIGPGKRHNPTCGN